MDTYFVSRAGNKDFLFHHLAINYIEFAKISLEAIFQGPKPDEESLLLQNASLYYFYYMQMALNACSGLWNIFFTDKNFHGGSAPAKKRASAIGGARLDDLRPMETPRCRASRLRKNYDISEKEFPILSNKTFRNTNEHFDERIDMVNGQLGDWNIITSKTEPDIQKEILTELHLRTVDLASWTYYTCDRQMRKISFSLKGLKSELEQLEKKLNAHPPHNEGVETVKRCNAKEWNADPIVPI